MHWAAVLFGWPAAITSVLASTAGLALRRPLLVWLGLLVGFPFMVYLLLTPRLWLFAAVALPCHVGAAGLARRSPAVAWLLFLPTVLATVSTAVLVIRGGR